MPPRPTTSTSSAYLPQECTSAIETPILPSIMKGTGAAVEETVSSTVEMYDTNKVTFLTSKISENFFRKIFLTNNFSYQLQHSTPTLSKKLHDNRGGSMTHKSSGKKSPKLDEPIIFR